MIKFHFSLLFLVILRISTAIQLTNESEPSVSPTRAPSTSPSQCHSLPIYTNKPMKIQSGLSTFDTPYCLYPKNNVLEKGNKIAISKCREWKSYQWIFTNNRQIQNVKDKSLCIEMRGERVRLQKCDSSSKHQFLRYSSFDQRIMAKTSIHVMTVKNGKAIDKSSVMNLYHNEESLPSHKWNIVFIDSTIQLIPLPLNKAYQIVSHLSSTSDQKVTSWCVYPYKNNFKSGARIVLAPCESWKSFQWTLDENGHIRSVKDPNMCITRNKKRLVLWKCEPWYKQDLLTYDEAQQTLSSRTNGDLSLMLKGKNNKLVNNIDLRFYHLSKGSRTICQSLWSFKKMDHRLKILPYGSTLTKGEVGFPGGYRKKLFQVLTQQGYNFDFIGSKIFNRFPGIDPDHEGTTDKQILFFDRFAEFLLNKLDTPDVILLHVGIFDFVKGVDLDNIMVRMENLLDALHRLRPTTRVMASNLITKDGGLYHENIEKYFNPFIEDLIKKKQNQGYKVNFVDINKYVQDTDVNNDHLLNQQGYDHMGDAWAYAIGNYYTP